MKLAQGSLLRPTWEYEIVDWKLVELVKELRAKID